MSECPICEERGFTLEFREAPDDEFSGEFYRLPCPNWRHALDRRRAAQTATPTFGVTEQDLPF